MVFIASWNLFDKNYLFRRKNWKMWFNIQFSTNWKIYLMCKPRLKENSKKQALWQFKSHQIEVLWNTGNRTAGLERTFRGSSSLQIVRPQRTKMVIHQHPTEAYCSIQSLKPTSGHQMIPDVQWQASLWEGIYLPELTDSLSTAEVFPHLLFS